MVCTGPGCCKSSIKIDHYLRVMGYNHMFHANFLKRRHRALYKRGCLKIIRDNFSYFSFNPYVVTPNLNRLIEAVQMRGHNTFLCRIDKNYP